MGFVLNSRAGQWLTRPVRVRLTRHSTRVARAQDAVLRKEVQHELTRWKASVESRQGHVEQIVNGLPGVLDDLRSEVAVVGLQVREIVDEVDERVVQLTRDHTSLRTEVAALAGQAREVVDVRAAGITRDIAELRSALDELGARVREVVEAEVASAASVRTVLAKVANVQGSIDLLLGPAGRLFSRLIDEQEVRALLDDLAFLGDAEAVTIAVHQAYRTLIEVESRCVGRYPGSTSNIVSKLAVVALLTPPSGVVMELGSYHGIGAVGVARQLVRVGLDVHLTIVDSSESLVDVSLTPRSRQVVEANLSLGGVSAKDYRFVDGRPEYPDVRKAIADRQYGLALIDGGFLADEESGGPSWIADLMAPGGIILLDHIEDPTSRSVAALADRLTSSPGAMLHLVGTAANVAVLRSDAVDDGTSTQ